MANLPLTGSQYWGAALNNYLRQINSDVAALKLRLDNFTVSASYSGSGWAENTYKISINEEHTAFAEPMGNNTAVFRLKSNATGFNATFKISGTLIFNNPASGRSQSINIPESQNMKITFGGGQADSDDLKVLHYLHYDVNGDYELVERGQTGITVLMPNDGYYPIYAIYDEDAGFKIALNREQEFIFTENYVLLGIALRSTVSGTANYFFGRKTDSAFKTIYETRKGNLESFATIINEAGSSARGIFQTTYDTSENPNKTGLKILLGSSIIDYHSNGISMSGDAASADDWDYKYPFDYKRFNSSGRSCYMVTTTDEGKDVMTSFTVADADLIDGSDFADNNTTFSKDKLYGIYLSTLGDIIIESTGNIDSITDVSGYTNDYIWDLNSDSNFRTGGLVFLGAFYHGESGWSYMHAAANSISPAFISSKSVENATIIKLPDVKYLAYKKADGSIGDPVPYQYELKVPTTDNTYTKPYHYLTMDTTYSTTAETDGFKRYHLFVAPGSFYSPIITSSAYKGVRFGNLQITVPTTKAEKPKWTIDENDILHGYHQFVSAKTDTTHVSASLSNGYDNILENVELSGKVRLSESTTDNSTFSINKRTLSDAKGISGGPDFSLSLVRSPNKSNLYLMGSETGSSTAKDFIISATDGSNATALKITGSNITLDASSTLFLNSKEHIQVGNTLHFTSDRRCKTNIKDLSTEVCVDLVKNLKAKSFTYTDTNIDSLGVIAQELEALCPEYKDILVSTTATDDIPDKKSVAETKLLFILWQAVQHLLNRGE